jgi:hypothetical protein
MRAVVIGSSEELMRQYRILVAQRLANAAKP